MQVLKKQTVITIILAVALLVFGAIYFTYGNANGRATAQGDPAPTLYTQPTDVGSLTRFIKVTGKGTANIKPDIAQTSIGVEFTALTVKEASAKTAEVMDAIISALKAEGVAAKDLQTNGYNVWMERPYGGGFAEPTMDSSQPSPDGTIYHVGNNLQVTVRDLGLLEAVLDAAIEAGANNIYGISFYPSDNAEIESVARAAAMDIARAKAEELAKLGGVELGEIISVTEYSSGGFYPSAGIQFAEASFGGGAGPVSPGELELSVKLDVVYAIK